MAKQKTEETQDPLSSFDDVLERANALVAQDAGRVTLQEDMRGLFLLEWDEKLKNKADWVKETRDPQPHDAVMWCVDVLAATEMGITVEFPDESMTQTKEVTAITTEGMPA